MDDVLKKKIEGRQKNITTNENLKDFGYLKGGISKSGKRMWVEIENRRTSNKAQWQREKEGLVKRCSDENGRTSWNKGLTRETDERIPEGWSKGLTKETDQRMKEVAKSMKGHKGNAASFKKGHIPWSKGKTGVYSEEILEKMSSSRMGIPTGRSPMKGKKHSEETKKKMSIAQRNNPMRPHFHKGHVPWNKGLTKESSEKMNAISEKQIKILSAEALITTYWKEKKNLDEVAEELGASKRIVLREMKKYGIETRSPVQTQSPTSYEKKIIALCDQCGFPFVFTGNSNHRLYGKIPDFIATDGRKMIIETYSAYWHSDEYEMTREAFFNQYDYKVLFLNDNDLNKKEWKDGCKMKIEKFMEEGK